MPLPISSPGTYTLTPNDRAITIAPTVTTASIVLLNPATAPTNHQVNITFAPGNTASTVTITAGGGAIGQLAGGTGASFTMSSTACTEATFQSDGTNNLLIQRVIPPVASGGGATLSETLTYGAALNARQPVYQQSDGKVYPMIGSLGTLARTPYASHFGGTEQNNYCVTPHPTIANRFIWCVPYSDGSLYNGYYDVTTAGAINPIANTAITGLNPVPAIGIGSGAYLSINAAGNKAVLMYRGAASGNHAIYHLGINSTGISGIIGSTTIAPASMDISPYAVPTSNTNKWLWASRGSVNSSWGRIDLSAATPVSTDMLNVTNAASTVKSAFLIPLTADRFTFVWANSSSSIQFRPFNFNVTSNAETPLSAGTQGFALTAQETAWNWDIIYQDANETWIAGHGGVTTAQIRLFKIINATGAVSMFSHTFTGDTLGANDYGTTVMGHRRDVGRFIINWRTAAAPTIYKAAEFSVDRTTGVVTQTIAPVSAAALPTTPDLFSPYAFGAQCATPNIAIVVPNNVSSHVNAIGTFGTAAPAMEFIGFNDTAGALNATGAVNLQGSIQGGFTGLTPGTWYYADLATGGVTTQSASGIIVGKAITSSKIQARNN